MKKEMSFSNYINKIYIICLVLSIIFFMLAGYVFPATEEDIERNMCNGEYERGTFTQFMTSIVFTLSMVLLGFFVNSTFVSFGVKYWNIFSAGIFLMFLYGLAKIGELTFSYSLFEVLKNLIFQFALIVIAYSLYKIWNNFKGGKKDESF